MEILTSGWNILLIILGFGLLICVHELGHFIAAKWAGIRTLAFAIGMGPVLVSWRKGIGFRLGSTDAEYEKRVREFLSADSLHAERVKNGGELRVTEVYRIGDKLGLGETEYSIRALPLGGFVKMLGQEDANPNALSDDPRSYTQRPIGKRMVVVSAGVVMNLILAAVLFMISFMVGVRYPGPVIGAVEPGKPASKATCATPGVAPGLLAGDRVLKIDGEAASTFADISIASAMSKPGRPLEFEVERRGYSNPLVISVLAEQNEQSGLLSIGVSEANSTRLDADDQLGQLSWLLQRNGLAEQGITTGMQVTRVGDRLISTYTELDDLADLAGSPGLDAYWQKVGGDGQPTGPEAAATLPLDAELQVIVIDDSTFELGLLGMTPLYRVAHIREDSANHGILKDGDVILAVGDVKYPRPTQLRKELLRHAKSQVDITVLRDNLQTKLTCAVNRNGQLDFWPEIARDLLIVAQPVAIEQRIEPGIREHAKVSTAAAKARIEAGSAIVEVNGVLVTDWTSLRDALRSATTQALEAGTGADIEMTVLRDTPDRARETVILPLEAEDVANLHELGWQPVIAAGYFDRIMVERSAGGNPWKAVVMGVEETHKLMLLTYLTIDRLFRGSVGVEQLRGPLGIVDMGSRVAQQGFMYLVFFLGMISVNLAVINFLPMPIVDGGLFLFLVYEKLKGRPPSVAFQNVATIIGLCLIGTIFVVTFYNDLVRLISGA